MTAQLIITCIYVIAPVVPMYICIIIVRRLVCFKSRTLSSTYTYYQILSHIDSSKGNISKKTRNLHRILVKVELLT